MSDRKTTKRAAERADSAGQTRVDVDPQIVNLSRVKAFQLCPRRYFYAYEAGESGLGILPLQSEKQAAHFGAAVHRALEVWYGPGKRRGGEQSGDRDWTPCMWDDAAKEAFLDHLPDDHDDEAKPTEGSSYGLILLQRYFDHFRPVDRRLVKRVRGVEVEIETTVGEDRIPGRLDMLVETQGPGAGWWHMQHKTLSPYVKIDGYLQEQKLDYHEPSYHIGAAQASILPRGEKLRGTLLNVLRKEALPTRKRQKTTGGKTEKWTEPNVTEAWIPFVREPIPIEREIKGAFKQEIPVLLNMMDECRETGIWPKHSYACMAYFKPCPYAGLCQGGPLYDDAWRVREADYVDEKRRGERR